MLRFNVSKIRRVLCDICNAIINDCNDLKEVEDLLIDRLYSGEETIELFSRLDVVEVLENEILDSVVSNIFMGRYIRESVHAKSTAYKSLMEGYYNVPGKDYDAINRLAIVRYRHDHSSFNKDKSNSSKRSTGLTIKFGKGNKSKKGSRPESKMFEKGHLFQFYVWKESFDAQHYFNIICAIILGILMLFFATSLVDQSKSIEKIEAGISDLNNLTSSEQDELQKESNKYNDFLLLMMA